MKVTIKVTQEHIDAAEFMRMWPLDDSDRLVVSQCCPLALAFADAGYPDAEVGLHLLRGVGREGIELPKVARIFRADFDYNEHVWPFSFQIELPW